MTYLRLSGTALYIVVAMLRAPNRLQRHVDKTKSEKNKDKIRPVRYMLLGAAADLFATFASLNYIVAAKTIGINVVLMAGILLGCIKYVVGFCLQEVLLPNRLKHWAQNTNISRSLSERFVGATFQPFIESTGAHGTVLITLCSLTGVRLLDRDLSGVLAGETLDLIEAAALAIAITAAIRVLDHLLYGWRGALIVSLGDSLYSLFVVVLGPSWLLAVVVSHMVNNAMCYLYSWMRTWRR